MRFCRTKIFGVMAAVVCLCSSFSASVEAVPVISIGDYSQTVGDVFTVDILIDGVEDGTLLYGFQMTLGFDSSVLKANSVSDGGHLASSGLPVVPYFYILPSSIIVAETLLGEGGATGDGILAKIEFEAIGVGVSLLDITDAILVHYIEPGMVLPLDASIDNGSVTVHGSSSVPEPMTLFLFLAGLGGLGMFANKRHTANSLHTSST